MAQTDNHASDATDGAMDERIRERICGFRSGSEDTRMDERIRDWTVEFRRQTHGWTDIFKNGQEDPLLDVFYLSMAG